jgi:hypothetical protein
MDCSEEEHANIEDVVDCRIILVRQVGDGIFHPDPNENNASSTCSFVDLTSDLDDEMLVQVKAKEQNESPQSLKTAAINESYVPQVNNEMNDAQKKNSCMLKNNLKNCKPGSKAESVETHHQHQNGKIIDKDDFPSVCKFPLEESGFDTRDEPRDGNRIQNEGRTSMKEASKFDKDKDHHTHSSTNDNPIAASNGTGVNPSENESMPLANSSLQNDIQNSTMVQTGPLYEGRRAQDKFVVKDVRKESAIVSESGIASFIEINTSIDADHKQVNLQNNIIEIIDSDSDSEAGANRKNANAVKDIDQSNLKKEISPMKSETNNAFEESTMKDAKPCIEILDDSDDDDDIEVIGVSIPQKVLLEKKRKLEEEKKADAVNFILQRSIKYAKKTRKMTVDNLSTRIKNNKKAKSFSRPNFTFFNADQPFAKTSSTQSSKKKCYPKRSNYYEAGRLEEQERLLKASADRVKAQAGVNKLLHTSLSSASDGQILYTKAVKDVMTLPKNHYKWRDPYSRLGVPRKSRYELVKRNYRKLCLLYHPDKVRHNNKESQDRFQGIKQAYEEIKESMGM